MPDNRQPESAQASYFSKIFPSLTDKVERHLAPILLFVMLEVSRVLDIKRKWEALRIIQG